MEDQQQVPLAFFPAPPPFYKHFTAENIAKLQSLRTTANPDAVSQPVDPTEATRSSFAGAQSLPAELQYLEPPLPPATGVYRCFGETVDISNPLPSLRTIGIEQVFPSPPSTPTGSSSVSLAAHRALHLGRIAKSILLNYLELVGVLSLNPSLWKQKVEDLQVLFYNMHHLINEYRAHHSRHLLVEMMEKQLQTKQDEIEGLRAMKTKVEEVLAGLGQDTDGNMDDSSSDEGEVLAGERQKELSKQRRMWDVLKKL